MRMPPHVNSDFGRHQSIIYTLSVVLDIRKVLLNCYVDNAF